ncbi:MAG TPA: hypothetical protein DCG57_15465 [Candidatus Riflebacteria bacterium]|nr:hypothetical protein [Candidatus Riflebacteria bacterium]
MSVDTNCMGAEATASPSMPSSVMRAKAPAPSVYSTLPVRCTKVIADSSPVLMSAPAGSISASSTGHSWRPLWLSAFSVPSAAGSSQVAMTVPLISVTRATSPA